MLILEKRFQNDLTIRLSGTLLGTGPMLTPPISESYWTYRVQLGYGQAIVGFPKFDTIGIGFAVEEDWNTNFPYWCSVEDIFNHISHNKGHEEISDPDCREAIRMIIRAAVEDRGKPSDSRLETELGPEYRAAMKEFHPERREHNDH